MAKKKIDIDKIIKARASAWTKEIVERANNSDKPLHISVSGKTFVKDGEAQMNISAKSPKGDARAYEYGSGIHSRLPNLSPMQQGSRGFILIKPKRKKLLAFHWDTMNNIMEEFGEEAVMEALRYSHKFKGFSEDGRYLFKYVDHPGVEAANGGRGYIGPAVTAVRAKIRRELPADLRKQITIEVGKFFRQSKES